MLLIWCFNGEDPMPILKPIFYFVLSLPIALPIACVLLFFVKKIFLWSIPHKVWGSFF